MSSLVTVELFAEDRAHEALLRPLIRRVCDEEGKPAEVRVRSARGGHGRAISEFEAYQRVLLRKGMGLPGAIVVAIDANCAAFAAAREQVTGALHRDLTDICVPACPDPHIEQWYLADLEAFRRVVGITPTVPAGKCERGLYKRLLANAVVAAGHSPLLGGIEFAPDLVAEMNLYRAGRSHTSLKHFITELRAKLRAL